MSASPERETTLEARPRTRFAGVASFDEALRVGLAALRHQRPTVLAHAVRAAEPRAPLRPLGVLCGDASIEHAFLGNALSRLVPPGTGLTRAAVRERAPVWVPSIAEAPRFVRGDLLTRHRVRSGAAFPVSVGSKIAAVIELLFFETRHPDAAIAATATSIATELRAAAARFRAV